MKDEADVGVERESEGSELGVEANLGRLGGGGRSRHRCEEVEGMGDDRLRVMSAVGSGFNGFSGASAMSCNTQILETK